MILKKSMLFLYLSIILCFFYNCTPRREKLNSHSPSINHIDCDLSTPKWLKSRDKTIYKCPTLPPTKKELTSEWIKLLSIMGLSLATGIPILFF